MNLYLINNENKSMKQLVGGVLVNLNESNFKIDAIDNNETYNIKKIEFKVESSESPSAELIITDSFGNSTTLSSTRKMILSAKCSKTSCNTLFFFNNYVVKIELSYNHSDVQAITNIINKQDKTNITFDKIKKLTFNKIPGLSQGWIIGKQQIKDKDGKMVDAFVSMSPLYNGGDMKNFMKNDILKDVSPDKKFLIKMSIIKQYCTTLKYLLNKELTYSDYKLDNLFYEKTDDTIKISIADIGSIALASDVGLVLSYTPPVPRLAINNRKHYEEKPDPQFGDNKEPLDKIEDNPKKLSKEVTDTYGILLMMLCFLTNDKINDVMELDAYYKDRLDARVMVMLLQNRVHELRKYITDNFLGLRGVIDKKLSDDIEMLFSWFTIRTIEGFWLSENYKSSERTCNSRIITDGVYIMTTMLYNLYEYFCNSGKPNSQNTTINNFTKDIEYYIRETDTDKEELKQSFVKFVRKEVTTTYAAKATGTYDENLVNSCLLKQFKIK